MSKDEICEMKTSKRKCRMKKMSAEYVILFFKRASMRTSRMIPVYEALVKN